MRKGWFRIAGLQDGDRSVDEQMRGLAMALEVAKGGTVLDLGAAEGLISAEFARAGALSVRAVELLADHCRAARTVCKGLPVEVVQAELAEYIRCNTDPDQFDVVLALGIAHKLHKPGDCLTFAARSATRLVVFRGPGKAGMYWDGWLTSKFTDDKCHVPTIFAEYGFEEGETLESAHGERAQYWWRD